MRCELWHRRRSPKAPAPARCARCSSAPCSISCTTCPAAKTSPRSRSIAPWSKAKNFPSFARSRTKTRRNRAENVQLSTLNVQLLSIQLLSLKLGVERWTFACRSFMRTAVLNTGTELLLGDVQDGHLSFIAHEIFSLRLRIGEQ